MSLPKKTASAAAAALPKVKSAGVLPYAVNSRGDVSFLLGRECYHPGWRDSDKWSLFGGKLESKETPLQGAARECYEETAGTIFMLPELVQKLENREYRMCLDLVYKKSRFLCFLIQVPYMDYPRMFRKTKEFVQYTKGKIDCIEKNQLRWFTDADLRAHMQSSSSVPSQKQQQYGRVPVFRRKFEETMRFFFSINGVQHLLPKAEQQPFYMQFSCAETTTTTENSTLVFLD